jgi:hypothetical protein
VAYSDILINLLCSQVFAHHADQWLGRARLLGLVRTQALSSTAADGPNEPWNWEFYSSYGRSEARDWVDPVRYSRILPPRSGRSVPWLETGRPEA